MHGGLDGVSWAPQAPKTRAGRAGRVLRPARPAQDGAQIGALTGKLAHCPLFHPTKIWNLHLKTGDRNGPLVKLYGEDTCV